MKIKIKSISFASIITDKYGTNRWRSHLAKLIFHRSPKARKSGNINKSVINLLTRKLYTASSETAIYKPVTYIYKNIYSGNTDHTCERFSTHIVQNNGQEVNESVAKPIIKTSLFNQIHQKYNKPETEKDIDYTDKSYQISNYGHNHSYTYIINNYSYTNRSYRHNNTNYNDLNKYDHHNLKIQNNIFNNQNSGSKLEHQELTQKEQVFPETRQIPAAALELRIGNILRTSVVQNKYDYKPRNDIYSISKHYIWNRNLSYTAPDINSALINREIKPQQFLVPEVRSQVPNYLQNKDYGLIFHRPKLKQAPDAEFQVPKDVLTAEKGVYAKVFTSSKSGKKPEHIGNDEVKMIAEKVYAIIEKKIEIQKDRRGI